MPGTTLAPVNESTWLEKVEVVLVRPETPGNVGAACRAMRNFGLSRLCVVGSEGITATGQARAFAHGCEDMLENARLCATLDEALAEHVFAVGTANRVRKSKLPALDGPETVIPEIAAMAVRGSCALVYGPESTGLTDSELARCTRLLRMPTAVDQPSLNLSQAVLLVAQECWRHARRDPDPQPILDDAPTHAEFHLLLERAEALMLRGGFRPYAGNPELFRLAARRALMRGRFERRDLRTLLTMLKALEKLSD